MGEEMNALSPAKAAEMLSCHPCTVYRLVQNGELEAFKLGGHRLRIRKDAIERYMEANKCTSSNTVENGQNTTLPLAVEGRYIPMTE